MRRSLAILGGLSLLALAVPALAAGWGAYASAFPTNPCADGWAGCVVGDTAVGPGFGRDSAGRPLLSGMRVGWFDLAPTPAFSPFVSLSGYRQASAGAANVLAESGPPPSTPPVAVDPGLAVPPVAAPTAAPTALTSPPALAAGTNRAPDTTARTASSPPSMYTPPATTGSASSPSGYTPVTTSPTVATAPTVAAPTVATAPVAAPATGQATDPTASSARTSAGTATPPATTDVVKVSEGCDDDVALQPLALMGQLTSGVAKCLEAKVTSDLPQTSRDKYSRVLIANAEAKGDKVEWERLVRRHLEDIDRSDPDLCYKYALQLSRGGVSRSSGVIRWTEYALENKQHWQGQTYKNRVYALYKLRAEAGARLWESAEKEFTTGDHTDENEAKATKLRGQAKDYAKEWLDYARSSGQDTQTAMSLCVSAAGNRQYCDGG